MTGMQSPFLLLDLEVVPVQETAGPANACWALSVFVSSLC